jgi:hypothetical protein
MRCFGRSRRSRRADELVGLGTWTIEPIAAAADFLYHYRTLCTSNEKGFSALWGKFAADILMQDWETALEDMARLREVIDSKVRRRLAIRCPPDGMRRAVRTVELGTRPAYDRCCGSSPAHDNGVARS